jgi:hypothetical protein
MSLPNDWVDAIFARLTVAYGDRFLAQWPGQQPDIVKAHWGAVLHGVSSGGIAYALQHLPPDYPPNAMQFDRLCRSRPSAGDGSRKALAGPAVDPEKVRRAMDAAARIGRHRDDPKAWARDLQRREEAGEILGPTRSAMWRAALPRVHKPSSDAGSSPDTLPDPVNVPAELAYPETPP